MELILKAKDIRVEFKGRDVLDINELEVYDYDRIGLVGANGAGKSTLLRVLLGELTAHLQSSVFKLSKDLIDSIHEEGIVAYTS